MSFEWHSSTILVAELFECQVFCSLLVRLPLSGQADSTEGGAERGRIRAHMNFDKTATVALIDWNWMGHHPTYFTHFAVAMAETGARVVPFCAEPEDFTNRLERLIASGNVRARIADATPVSAPTPSRFRPARWRNQFDAVGFFRSLGRQVREREQTLGRPIDLVFFACIYDRQFEHFRLAQRWFRYPWSGLYLHARSFRLPGSPIPYTGGLPCPEKIFSSPTMHSAAVLDEGAVGPLRTMTGGKPVYLFPDLTQTDLPPERLDGGLAGKIHQFAAGRKIVSLTGQLQWTKGLDVFTRAAIDPAMRDVFFFLGGDVHWGEVSAAEKRALQHAWETLPNVFAHLQHLPEPTMNAIIASSDAVVACYRSFPNSSNALTKAAVFERPVVVSDGYLMAERVRGYGLGEVIPEGDSAALVAALQRMLAPGYQEALRDAARWQDYRDAHSARRLTEVFSSLLADVC